MSERRFWNVISLPLTIYRGESRIVSLTVFVQSYLFITFLFTHLGWTSRSNQNYETLFQPFVIELNKNIPFLSKHRSECLLLPLRKVLGDDGKQIRLSLPPKWKSVKIREMHVLKLIQYFRWLVYSIRVNSSVHSLSKEPLSLLRTGFRTWDDQFWSCKNKILVLIIG